MSLERYVLSPAIAAGGMGTVHLAVAPNPSEPLLALKRVHRHLAPDPTFARMLAAEAGIASCIRHDNVVATYGADLIGTEVVMVMEYVHGLTLRNLAELCRGPMPPRIAAAIVAGALRGLHAAHEAVDANGDRLRIVHCDVSPQNVLIGVDGVARVLDFGVSKVEQPRGEGRKGEVHCKIAYAAPEQLTGDGHDRRTDVYAAAVLLWESLVGRPLFGSPGEWNVVAKVLSASVTRPRHLVPEIPRGLDAIVMRSIHPHPKERFATALDMALAIESVFARSHASPREVAAWMRQLAGAEDLLRMRARLVATLRGKARQTAAPTRVSSIPAPPPRRSRPFVSRLLGLYCLVFFGALAGGLVGSAALAGHDEPLRAQHER